MHKSATGKVRALWRSIDIYGSKVQLTFKGKDKFRTSIGAFISLAVITIICIFIVFEIYMINNMLKPTVSVKSTLPNYVLNAINNTAAGTGFNPPSLGFDLAIGVLI